MRSNAIENHSKVYGLRARVYAARWVLVSGLLVFLGLYLAGKLGALDSTAAFCLIYLSALIAPRRMPTIQNELLSKTRIEIPLNATLRRFADALPDPCLIVDKNVNLHYSNSAAYREFPVISVGDPLAFSLRNPACLNAIEQAIESNQKVIGEFHETVPADNWYKIAVSPLQVDEGVDDHSSLMIVSIVSQTAQRKNDQMRADFVANASHELRTPLTSLIGFLETLRGPAANDTAAREKFMGIMHAQAERMSRLIDDLLSLSRIELHQHMRPTSDTDIAAITKEAIELLQPQAQEVNVEINFINELEDNNVVGDRNELVQVMTNLIENAIKYGTAGKKVDVNLGYCSLHDDHKIRIDVVDYGQGISAEHVPRLTERFYRVNAESSRQKKGTGLGLAIVKHIIGRHRGDIQISSQPGEGTKVSLCLP